MLCFQSETMIGDVVGEWLSFPKLNILSQFNTLLLTLEFNLPHGCEFGGLVQNNLQT
jgi:hypothetical protein